jgi:hypothetical protein
MTYFYKKEDFAANCYPDEKTGGPWLDRRWAVYQAERAFIGEVYTDQAVKDRLYAHILPNRTDGIWHDDCTWINECEDIFIQASRRGKDRVFDSDAGYAYDKAPEAIAAYLAAPREFQTRKADTFFARYALNAVVLLNENGAAEAKSMTKFGIGFIAVSYLIQLAAGAGLTALGWNIPDSGHWLTGAGYFIAAWTLFWAVYAILKWMFTAPKRRRIFKSVTDEIKRYRAIADELYTQSFDAETLLNRLRAIEADTGTALPTYIYTLLKRLSGEAA